MCYPIVLLVAFPAVDGPLASCMMVHFRFMPLNKWQSVCKFSIMERSKLIDLAPLFLFLFITQVLPVIFLSIFFTLNHDFKNTYLNSTNYGYLIVKNKYFSQFKTDIGFYCKMFTCDLPLQGQVSSEIRKSGVMNPEWEGLALHIMRPGNWFCIEFCGGIWSNTDNDNNGTHNHFTLVSSFLKGLLTSPISPLETHYLFTLTIQL